MKLKSLIKKCFNFDDFDEQFKKWITIKYFLFERVK